jgi:hypothetical protein
MATQGGRAARTHGVAHGPAGWPPTGRRCSTHSFVRRVGRAGTDVAPGPGWADREADSRNGNPNRERGGPVSRFRGSGPMIVGAEDTPSGIPSESRLRDTEFRVRGPTAGGPDARGRMDRPTEQEVGQPVACRNRDRDRRLEHTLPDETAVPSAMGPASRRRLHACLTRRPARPTMVRERGSFQVD